MSSELPLPGAHLISRDHSSSPAGSPNRIDKGERRAVVARAREERANTPMLGAALYLGLYIAESERMKYKARFLPHQRRIDGTWQTFDRET